MEIVSLGEVLIDMLPQGQAGAESLPLYRPRAGGAPCNVLAQASRLDHETAIISCVGDDFFGRHLRAVLIDEGIDVRQLQVSPDRRTSLSFVSHDASGDRDFIFYRDRGADLAVGLNSAAEALIRESRIFHCGSLTMAEAPARSATQRALSLAQEAGVLVSFDPNFRPALWKEGRDLLAACLEILPSVDILKISADELASLARYMETGEVAFAEAGALPTETVEAMLDLLFSHFDLALIAVTDGGSEAYLANREACVHAPARQVQAVDTTGCGDAFMGALLSRLLESWPKSEEKVPFSFFTDLPLLDLLTFASAAGTLTALEEGSLAALPDRTAIEHFLF